MIFILLNERHNVMIKIYTNYVFLVQYTDRKLKFNHAIKVDRVHTNRQQSSLSPI